MWSCSAAACRTSRGCRKRRPRCCHTTCWLSGRAPIRSLPASYAPLTVIRAVSEGRRGCGPPARKTEAGNCHRRVRAELPAKHWRMLIEDLAAVAAAARQLVGRGPPTSSSASLRNIGNSLAKAPRTRKVVYRGDPGASGGCRDSHELADPGDSRGAGNPPAMDQDAWVTAGHYEKRDPRKSVEVFSVLREMNLALFDTLTPEHVEAPGSALGAWCGDRGTHRPLIRGSRPEPHSSSRADSCVGRPLRIDELGRELRRHGAAGYVTGSIDPDTFKYEITARETTVE